MNEDLKEQLEQSTRDFLQLKIMESSLLSPDLKELTFFKISVKMDNGGIYLLSFMHVDGPKIPLKKETQQEVLDE